MPRSAGTFTAPSSSVNPAVEGTTIDETDFNALIDDIESALTESAYTAGLGSTDNQLVRTDGTDTKKLQGTGITVDDSNNVSGIAGLSVTTVNIGNADTTLARTGAGDISVEGNAIYRAGGTDVAIADGGTGASTATAAFNALAPTTTQGDIIYHNGTNNVRLGAGTAGQVLQTGGAGANPSWTNAGAGDVTGQASSVDSEIALFSGTGGKTIKRATTTGILKGTSGVVSAATAGTDYYAPGGTDVAIADGGTGASSAAAGARALLEGLGTTQGDILYRNGTQWTALGTGTVGQVLQAGGAGANPAWATVAGTGDVTAATSFGTDGVVILSDGTGKGVKSSSIAGADLANITTAASAFSNDNRLIRSDGTGKGVQGSAVTVDDSGNVTGAPNLVTLTGTQTLTNKTLTAPTIDSVNTGPLAGFRNRLINGDIALSQRNATTSTTTADNAYWADRWRYLGEASADCKAGDTTAAINGIPVHGTIKLTGTTDKGGAWQVIEGIHCKDLRGKSVSFSIALAVSNVRLGNIKIGIVEFTGIEDSVSGDPISAWGADGTTPTLAAGYAFLNTPANLSVTTSLVRYSVTGTVGSSANNLAVFIWNDDKSYTANDSIYLGAAQLEIGGTATPFEFRPRAVEVHLCQRYRYQSNFTTPKGATVGSQSLPYAQATTYAFNNFLFLTPMRTTPTMTFWNAGVQNQVRNANTAATVALTAPVSGVGVTVAGFSGLQPSGANFSVGTPYDFDFIADAEL